MEFLNLFAIATYRIIITSILLIGAGLSLPFILLHWRIIVKILLVILYSPFYCIKSGLIKLGHSKLLRY